MADPKMPKEQVECDSCGFETRALTFTNRPLRPAEDGFWMCVVCRSTFIANATLYPSQHNHDGDTLKAIGWGINTILAAIEKGS